MPTRFDRNAPPAPGRYLNPESSTVSSNDTLPPDSKDLEQRVALLESRLHEKTVEAEVLRRVGQAISQMMDLSEMLQMVSEIVVNVTETDLCLIYILNDAKTELVLRATNGPAKEEVGKIRLKVGEGITGWVAKTGEHVALVREAFRDSRFKLVPELKQDKYTSMLSVPILGRRELLGVINLRTNKEHEYSQANIQLIEIIAEQLSCAIENSHRFNQMKRRASQLSTLSEISRTITSNLYLEEILQFIVAVTAQSMNLSICSLMLVDEEKQELTIKATTSQSKDYIKKPNIKMGESIAGQAVTEGRPVSVLDVKKTPGYRYPDIAKREGLCSLISIPLVSRGKIIGVLNCYTEKPHQFSDDEVGVLTALASNAVIAIENSQLHVRSAILQEMHHRVKNNLQTVASLLRLQMRYGREVTTESALTESINRIQAIAVVHDMLSREDLDTISVRKLAETIMAAHASSSVPRGHNIKFSVEGPDTVLASHHATAVALILNELIQNALEHGLGEVKEGDLRVEIEVFADQVRILVENTGKLLPEGFDYRRNRNLGLQIVDNLVRDDLRGTFELKSGQTTRAEVHFHR